MKISEIMVGLDQVDEGVLGSIGRAAEKAFGNTAKAVGYMSGVPGAMGTMYQQGKARAQAGITGQLPNKTGKSTVNPEYQRYLKNYMKYGTAEPPQSQDDSASPDDMDNYASQMEKDARALRSQADMFRQQQRSMAQQSAGAASQQAATTQTPNYGQTTNVSNQQFRNMNLQGTTQRPTASLPAVSSNQQTTQVRQQQQIPQNQQTTQQTSQAQQPAQQSASPQKSPIIMPTSVGSGPRPKTTNPGAGASVAPKSPAPGASANPANNRSFTGERSQEQELRDFGLSEKFDRELAEMLKLVNRLKR